MINSVAHLKEVGKHMPRTRYQQGWVEETGKHIKKWRGHYYVYTRTLEGQERRAHRAITLGPKSKMRKWEAECELRAIIEKETTGTSVQPSPEHTFLWFWENRFLPLKEGKWRRSTRDAVASVVGTHFLPRFGGVKLSDLNRFDLQSHVNQLARSHSRSVVQKVKVWVKASLDEAVEQDFLHKNPAGRLDMPKTRETCKRYLSAMEVQRLLSALDERDHLIVRLFILCALRPGELFALRWNDIESGRLRIDEAIYRGRIGDTKTEASNAHVALPQSIQSELAHWRRCCDDPPEDDFIFSSQRGTPLDGHNYLRRFLAPLASKLGICGVTFQSLRRTFATLVHGLGTIKDAQAQLRHADAATTMNTYTQAIPASVRSAVEALDEKLRPVLNNSEHKFQM
jgi:integrase